MKAGTDQVMARGKLHRAVWLRHAGVPGLARLRDSQER